MAYINFAAFTAGQIDTLPTPLVPALSELEQTAVAIGARDTLSSLPHHGCWSRRIRAFFGVRAVPPLADPKLEAIRRLVVAVRLGSPALAAAQVLEALKSGIKPHNVRQLQDRFREWRSTLSEPHPDASLGKGLSRLLREK